MMAYWAAWGEEKSVWLSLEKLDSTESFPIFCSVADILSICIYIDSWVMRKSCHEKFMIWFIDEIVDLE